MTKITVIASSDYFINYIFALPLKSGYWKIIPKLLCCSKRLRTKIFPRLPEWFQKIIIILSGARCNRSPVTNCPRMPYTNSQIIYAQLYRANAGDGSSLLKKYIECVDSLRSYTSGLKILADTPRECVRNWDSCRHVLLRSINLNSSRRSRIMLGGCTSVEYEREIAFTPEEILYYLEDAMNRVESGVFQISAPNDSPRTKILRIGDKQYIIQHTTRIKTQVTKYGIADLPLKAHRGNLCDYFLALWGSKNDPELIRRFYCSFCSATPGTNATDPGAWDMLMFCFIFNLDLDTMVALE